MLKLNTKDIFNCKDELFVEFWRVWAVRAIALEKGPNQPANQTSRHLYDYYPKPGFSTDRSFTVACCDGIIDVAR